MKTYKYYQDAMHGWIAVKRKELEAYDISDKITSFSYQKGDTVYLEEDCDAATFYNKVKEKTGEYPTLTPKYVGEYATIRYYERYKR